MIGVIERDSRAFAKLMWWKTTIWVEEENVTEWDETGMEQMSERIRRKRIKGNDICYIK